MKERPIRVIIPLCTGVFLACLTVGISLGAVPAFIHQTLQYNNLIVGLVIGIQSAATLASRHYAGTLCDRKGSRQAVRTGVLFSTTAGIVCLLAALTADSRLLSLLVLLAGRILLGIGESFMITGALSWGVGLLGHHRSGKVMAWVGIAIYGAVACGAPLAMLATRWGGERVAFAAIALVPSLAWLAVARLESLPVTAAHRRVPFYRVIGQVGLSGSGLALATASFGGLASFISLYFTSRGWSGAGMALLLFGTSYILVRLFFAHLPDRFGGSNVAIVSLVVQAAGQLLIWTAPLAWMALAGAFLTGLGFSLVFPAFGVEVVRKAAPENRGVAMGAYVAFFDLSMGLTAPLAGLIAGRFGYASIYCFGAFTALCSALLALSMRKAAAAKPNSLVSSGA